jgi:hypothetical protein
MSGFDRGVLFAGVVGLLAAGCGDAKKDDVVTFHKALAVQFSLVTPNGDPKATLLSASDSLVVDDRVTIGTTALEVAAAFGTSTTTQIAAGVQAHANLTSRAPVFMGSSATIFGSARSGSTITKQLGARVLGGEFPNSAITSVPTQWTVGFPDTNQGDVILQPDQTRTLAPGAWGNLNVNSRSTVFLRSGTYYFQSVNTEPQARIMLDKTAGAIFIYVRNAFSLKGAFVSNGGPEGEVLVGYLGTSIAYIEVPLLGTIVAPNATVDLRRPPDNSPHRGAVFAKGIHVLSNATVLRLPFSWTFLCPLGDSDGDGVVDCVDGCPKDPNKTSPRACGCGKPETDSDTDGIPDCIEPICKNDPNNSTPGDCGCVGFTTAPAGTLCKDARCPIPPGTQPTCNGAGVCGNPNTCMPGGPNANCKLRQLNGRQYWFCPGPVTWTTAVANCRAIPNRSLVRVSTLAENDFLQNLVGGPWWTGANAQASPGNWRWASPSTNNGDQFWTGGPGGSRVDNRFTRWAGGQPDQALTCGTLDQQGFWSAKACTQTTGYICEEQIRMPLPVVPPLDCGKFFPARSCQTTGNETQPPGGDTPGCVQESTVFTPDAGTEQTFNEIAACNAAGQAGTCTADNRSGCDAACRGAATVPPPGSTTCPPFEDEEKSFCGIQNLQEAGCTAEQDCCQFARAVLISSGVLPNSLDPVPQNFDINEGGLGYIDDAFQLGGPAAGGFEVGVRSTTAGNPAPGLQISLGGINNTTVTNMTGAYQFQVTLVQESLMIVSFDYNLTQSPNYESNEISQVLLSVGPVGNPTLKGRTFNEYVDQVAGDGEGGPNISTGWKTFTRNLGLLQPGTYQVRIGGRNTQKTNVNEFTTILLDNVLLFTRTDNCAPGFTCAPTYPNGDGTVCNPCETQDSQGVCTKECGRPVLRCGQPVKNVTGTDGGANCSDNDMFPQNEPCQQIELCSGPESTGSSDPTEGGNLGATTFDPNKLGLPSTPPGVATDPYPPDGPCPKTPSNPNGQPPCAAQGKEHPWCKYDVENPIQPRATPAPNKHGDAGGSGINFSFAPDANFSMSIEKPGPFGEADLKVDTSASLRATVGFHLGRPVPDGTIDIIDANLHLHVDRCSFTNADSRLVILEHDFLPETGLKVDSTPIADVTACNDKIEQFKTQVKRVKKAYRDAIDLVRQYNVHKQNAAQGVPTKFRSTFCQDLIGNPPPAGFPPGNCAGETSAATINRFVQFYRNQVTQGLRPAFQALADSTSVSKTLAQAPTATRETQTIFEATFPIGPIPLVLEVEAFVEYGLQANLVFSVLPQQNENGQPEVTFVQFANLTGEAKPYALAGVSLFVGVGFGVNGFKASAGVEGAITLGRLGLNASAGAGFGLQVAPDPRRIPDDIVAAAPVGIQDTKQTLFPIGAAKQYTLGLNYNYGLAVDVNQILAGTISARLRIKFFFFSKTWRKKLLRFPGFGLPEPINLISGGGQFAAQTEDPFGWGTVQMPLPFVELASLDQAAPELTGAEQDLDKNFVEKFFYDSLCTCQQDLNACVRTDDCCGPASTCFSDPFGTVPPGSPAGTKFCRKCGQPNDSCNTDGDCCFNPNSVCRANRCTCVAPGGSCGQDANCCTGDEAGTFPFLDCNVDPRTPGLGQICRTCLHTDEDCVNNTDCCSEGSAGSFCEPVNVDGNSVNKCVPHQVK